MVSNKSLRMVANRGNFDKGKELSQRTAIEQSKFISQHFSTLKEIDKRSRPVGWKIKKFRECAEKINQHSPLDEFSLSFIDQLYELVISKVYGVEAYKPEFYKGHHR
jgi:hypothetical protein